MSHIYPGAGFPPVPTFAIVHPDMPDAGEVQCDEDAFAAWSSVGWVKVDDAPKKKAKG